MREREEKVAPFGLGLVFVLAIFTLPLSLGASTAYLQTRNTIAVVQTGCDPAIARAIDGMNLTRFNHPVIIVWAESPGMLETIVESSIYLITIYVGHGSPEGLSVHEEVVPWSSLREWIRGADNTFHIVTACHGIGAMSIEAQNSFGLPGLMDARVAGYVVQVVIAELLGLGRIVQSLVLGFFNNPSMIGLLWNPALPLVLGPWGPWVTNPAQNIVITGVIYAFLALGAAYIAAYLLSLIGITLVGAALSGFNFAIQTIVNIALTLVAQIWYCWRDRYDPDTMWVYGECQFRVVRALPPYGYIWISAASPYDYCGLPTPGVPVP